MAYSSVPTVHGAILSALKAVNATRFTPEPFSTLNEEFGIQAGNPVPDGNVPVTGYLVAGRGGHRNVQGADGAALTDILQHKITDACLFKHLPFVMREVDDDLSATERSKYRLRRVENHHGKNYFVYYMRKITIDKGAISVSIHKTLNGKTTVREYEPTEDQLNPVPVTMTNGEVNTANGEDVVVSLPVTINLDDKDISEIINCATIIYGDARYANITELAICSAHDAAVTVNDGGKEVTYTEALAAQCINFMGADINLKHTNRGVKLDYKLAWDAQLFS